MDRIDIAQTVPLRPDEVRRPIAQFAESSTLLGLVVFATAFAAHLLTIGLALQVDDLLLKAMLGVLGGFSIGVLFVVGHDCAHGNLVRSKKVNRFLAMMAFLPSLHPVCSWELGHNKLHHGWTNLRGKDDVYAPLSVQEYEALTPGNRLLHRLYRSVGGFGFYYLIDVWLRAQILCRPQAYVDMDRRQKGVDFAAVAVWLGLWIGACIVGNSVSVGLWNLTLCLVMPFVVWNYVMTFVTFQQHTHPDVRWFDRRDEWSFFDAQVANTVHVRLPSVIDWVFGRIFQHTAHHVHKGIPMYRLMEAQRAIEAEYPLCKIVDFSVVNFFAVLGTCKLYDYRRQQWVPFSREKSTNST